MKAAEYCQRFTFDFGIMVDKTKTASNVLRPRRNPYCSSPSNFSSSMMVVMILHIRKVSIRSKLEGTVSGR